MISDIALASLLCSRLCHDLVSPIGALNNGVEVLQEAKDPAFRDQALALLQESAKAAIGRLLFFRLAFGAATGFSADIPLAEARAAAEGLFSSGRIKLDWPREGQPNSLDKTAVKLLLNLLLVGGESLLRGGVLRVGCRASGEAVVMTIEARGKDARMHDENRTALAGRIEPGDVELRNVQAWYAAQLATQLGAEINLETGQIGVVGLSAWVPASRG